LTVQASRVEAFVQRTTWNAGVSYETWAFFSRHKNTFYLLLGRDIDEALQIAVLEPSSVI